jgi:hypothetical protein
VSSGQERLLEELEARLAAIPAEGPGLDAAGARSFRKARARIGRHHQAWRAGMPGLDSMFDNDAHRARALAGSLCTELEDVLIAWSRLRAALGDPGEAARRFVDDAAERWRVTARGFVDAIAWDAEGREAFAELVDALVTRAHERGLAALRGDGRPAAAPPSRLALGLRRLVRLPVLATRRFFRPDA